MQIALNVIILTCTRTGAWYFMIDWLHLFAITRIDIQSSKEKNKSPAICLKWLCTIRIAYTKLNDDVLLVYDALNLD